jgi:methylmalonyl-CoA mutase cobalamin-binding subunit
MSDPTPFGPLAGLKVIELGQLIAGPFAGKTLGDFGAEVIKIEPPAAEGKPGGDPLRLWRMLHNGTSVWWQVQSRNKKSVALDLKDPESRDIVRRLIISVSRGYLRNDQGPCLVLATLSGERHELGILMCSWLAATRRFRTHYLGADCPAEELARFALEVEARAVLVSLVMPENEVPALEQLATLAAALRGRCEVWVGGFAARMLLAEELPPGCVMLPTGQDFEQRLDLLSAQHYS